MDTRWKKFRYGSETCNPAWSFFGALLCLECMLLFLTLAVYRGDIVCAAAGTWFLIFSLLSLRHLGGLMKNDKNNLVPIALLDHTWPDLVIGILLVFLFLYGRELWGIFAYLLDDIFEYFWTAFSFLGQFLLIFFASETVIFFLVILYMSLLRHMSHERLKKKLFVFQTGKEWKKKWKRFRKWWDTYWFAGVKGGKKEKLFRRKQLWLLYVQGLFFLLACLYLASVYWELEDIMVLVLPVGLVFFLIDYWYVVRISREVGVLLDEIHQIAKEEIIEESPVLNKHSVLREAEKELLAISRNKKESVEKRLQSERMKVDLITNVSHDLKTPLTSIIGCVDLLKQVEGLPGEAEDYVKLLSMKAEHLKGMIQDVFDMAKATSGQELKMERLDMVRLIRQTMADMQDQVERSGLHFRVRMEKGELHFLGDSKKMYRVYQNLIENALKYSMAGSRVYVEVKKKGDRIQTSVKNTSAREMDFTPEEITERFTRGDKSRSTEGNGLGLAIARSFTEACGGSFQVTLDGDLFKAETVFRMEGAFSVSEQGTETG